MATGVTWEYKTFVNQGHVNMKHLTKTLNDEGQQGWEVVAAVPANSGQKDSGIIVPMKRPR